MAMPILCLLPLTIGAGAEGDNEKEAGDNIQLYRKIKDEVETRCKKNIFDAMDRIESKKGLRSGDVRVILHSLECLLEDEKYGRRTDERQEIVGGNQNLDIDGAASEVAGRRRTPVVDATAEAELPVVGILAEHDPARSHAFRNRRIRNDDISRRSTEYQTEFENGDSGQPFQQ